MALVRNLYELRFSLLELRVYFVAVRLQLGFPVRYSHRDMLIFVSLRMYCKDKHLKNRNIFKELNGNRQMAMQYTYIYTILN